MTALVLPKTNKTDFLLGWVEGETNNAQCSMRNGTLFVSPLADRLLLDNLMEAMPQSVIDNKETS